MTYHGDPAHFRLADYIEDALRLCRRLEGWERDKRYIRSGGKIIYSIDTNIVKLFLDPADRALPTYSKKGQTREGYTEVFRHDPASTTIALADSICDAIFFSPNTEEIGVVVLRPLQPELDDMLHFLLSRSTEVAKVVFKDLDDKSQVIKLLMSETISLDERYKALSDNLIHVADYFLDDRGPHAEMRRLSRLANMSKMLSIDKFISDFGDRFDILNRIKEIGNIGNVFDKIWIDQKIRGHLKRKKEGNAERDVKAVAHILAMNNLLMPHNLKLVHVTGDQSLFNATSDLKVIGLPGISDDEGFASAFLRHPTSFLAAPNVAFPSLPLEGSGAAAKESASVVAWLNVFLTGFRLDEDYERSTINDRAQRVMARSPGALSAFEASWRQFVTPMILRRSELSAKRRMLMDKGSFFSSLRGRIEEEFTETYEHWIQTATSTGFDFAQEERSPLGPARDVPSVWFDCQPKVDVELAKIQASLNEYTSGQQKFFEHQSAILAFRELDPSGYFFYVSYSVLFASANRWKTSLILAERAAAVVEKPSGENKVGDEVTGREAYYVCCVATKVSAQRADDYTVAAGYLDKARAALERDQQFFRRTDQPERAKLLTSLRFDVEELTLDLSRYLFAVFQEGTYPVQCLPRMDFAERSGLLLGRLDQEADPRVCASMERRILVNLMSRFLHDRGWRDEARGDEAARSFLLAHLARLTASLRSGGEEGAPARIPASFLHRAVVQAAVNELGASDLLQPHERDPNTFSEKVMRANAVTKYDFARFEELRRFSAVPC